MASRETGHLLCFNLGSHWVCHRYVDSYDPPGVCASVDVSDNRLHLVSSRHTCWIDND
jgi:hypothetical protein